MIKRHGKPVLFRHLLHITILTVCLLLPGLLLPACPDLVGQFPYGPTKTAEVVSNLVYYGSGEYLVIADCTDPANLVELGKITISTNIYGIHVVGTYAYVADHYNGLRIIDVSDPSSPSQEGFLPFADTVRDVKVQGTYAFVANSAEGLKVVNVFDPSTPVEVGTCDTPDLAAGVALQGNFAYVADRAGGLRIIDISKPNAPSEVGSSPSPHIDTDVDVIGDYAYLTAGNSGFRIVDISTPTAPVQVGLRDTDGSPNGLDVEGSYAYIGDYGSFRVMNVSNPANPVEVGSYSTKGWAFDAVVSGNYAYVSDYWGGLLILDISAPSSPSPVATSPPWSAQDVYVKGDYAYVADLYAGLRVIDISTLTDPQEVAVVSPTFGSLGLTVRDDLAYVAGGQGGLRIVDISVPTAPVLIGTCNTPGQAYCVVLSGDIAYVADAYEGVRIIDISVPTAPVEVQSIATANQCRGVSVSDNMLYIAAGSEGLLIYDISTPTSPVYQGIFPTPYAANYVRSHGDTAYLVTYLGDLRLLDVSNPASPSEAGYLDLPGSTYHVTVSGGYAYVGSLHISGGRLCIVDISNPVLPVLVTDYTALDDTMGIFINGFYAFSTHKEKGLAVLSLADCCTNPPGTFSITNPSSGATGQACTLTLDWTDSAEALHYDIRLDTVSPPTTNLETDYPWSDLTADFNPGTTYYWYPIAENGCGNNVPGIYSFTTQPVPGSFSLSYPADGAVDMSTTLPLDWQDSSSATSYSLYLGPGSNLALYQEGITASDLTVPGLNPDTTYSWYVVAENNCGTRQSPRYSFTTGHAVVEYFSHTFTDSCSAGGTGSGDTFAAPGEILSLPVALQNTGPALATGVSATLSTTTPHVFITSPTALYPDIPAGQIMGSLSPYSIQLSELISCPSIIDIDVTITSNEGTWNNAFQIDTGEPGSSALKEYFELWPPAGWTIVDNAGSCTWESTGTTGRTNYAGGNGFAAAADCDWCGAGMDTELISPVMDLSLAANATLYYTAAYRDLEARAVDYFNVDISTNGGTVWTNLLSWNESHDPFGPGEVISLDLTPFVGFPNTHVRFHYVSTAWDWYALIDSVLVITVPHCILCDSFGPPGETAKNGSFTLAKNMGDLDFSWTIPGGTCDPTEYGIYTGDIASLASGYSHDTALVCSHGGTTFSLPLNDADLNLTTGQYFLVVSGNGIQEGSYGSSTAGQPRPVSTNSCHGGEQDMTECNP